MSKINMRSVKRDLQVMSLGLGAIQREINILENRKSKDKSTKKRLERLYVAKQQLIENPKESKELMEKIK
tara:strand:- start:1257 stop:1466 length:210 start_codon:yes stop_codon:yes gene_type:complete